MSKYKVKSTNARIADAKEETLAEAEESLVVTVAPTAVAADRGKLITIDGGTGVADIVQICVKGADNAYSYKTVTIS